MFKQRCTARTKHTRKRCKNQAAKEALRVGQKLCWSHFKQFCPPVVVGAAAETAQLTDTRSREAELEQEIAALRKALSAVRTEEEWKALDSNLQMAKAELTQTRSAAKQEVDSLRAQIETSLKNKDANCASRISELLESKQGLEAALRQLEATKTELAERVRLELVSKYGPLLANSEAKVRQSDQAVQDLQKRLQEQAKVCEKCTREQKDAVAKWSNAAAEYRSQIDSLTSKLKECQSASNSGDEKSKARIQSLSQQLRDAEAKLRDSQTEYQEHLGEMTAASEKNAAVQQQQLAEINKLQEELEEAKGRIESLADTHRRDGQQYAKSQSNVANLRKQVDDLEDQVAKLTKLQEVTLQEATDGIRQVQAEMDDLEKKYVECQEEVAQWQIREEVFEKQSNEYRWMNRNLEHAESMLESVGVKFKRLEEKDRTTVRT